MPKHYGLILYLSDAGTFVRLQPETADFQKAAAEVMEDVLVAAIFKRSALSRGDWIDVDVHGTNHRLKVQQLQPKHQVSVIGTPTLALSSRDCIPSSKAKLGTACNIMHLSCLTQRFAGRNSKAST